MTPTRQNLQEAEGIAFERRRLEIEEALELAVREGVMPPHKANAMTQEEKEVWFDSGFQKSQEDEIPF